MTDALDLEVDALSILDNATDYNSGVDALKKLYPQDEESKLPAGQVIADYGDKLFYKFRETPADPIDLTEIAPIKPHEVQGEDNVSRINNWEQANLSYLDEVDDPDYIVSRKSLGRQIKAFASDARRDERSDYGDGPGAGDILEKFPRAAEGFLGPIGSAFGNDDLGNYFKEFTKKEDDSTLASALASTAGALIPALVAEAATAGSATPVLLTQTLGATRAAYNRYLEATGDEDKAAKGATLAFAGQAVGFIPLGRAASGIFKTGEQVASAAAKEGIEGALAVLQPMGLLKSATVAAAEGALGGSAGQIVGNLGEAIGTDQNIDITEGVATAAISNAILGGSLRGTYALVHDIKVNQFKQALKQAHAEEANPIRTIEKTLGPEPESEKATQESIKAKDMFPFEKDDDGHYILKDATPDEFDRRVEETESIYKSIDDVQKEITDPLLYPTNEAGEAVGIGVQPDVTTTLDEFVPVGSSEASMAGKIITSEDPNAIKPNRFTTYLAQKILGSDVSLQRNVEDGAFGAFYPKDGSIKILRSLGADANKLSETLAHEVGHLVDGFANQAFTSKGLKGLAQKLTGLKAMTDDVAQHLFEDGREISKVWRPGWDGSKGNARGNSTERFNSYRNNAKEVYADVFSAIVNSPDWVRTKYPKVMEAFEESMLRNPDLFETWKTFQEFEIDPDKISDFDFKIRQEARSEQGTIARAAEVARQKTIGQKLKERLDEAYQYTFDRYAPAKEAFGRLPAEVKPVAYDILNNLTRKDYVSHFIKRSIDLPIKNVLSKITEAGITENQWAQFEWANRVINETTPTIEKVKQSPEVYAQAVPVLRAMLSQIKGVNPSVLDSVFEPSKISTTDGLIQAFASLDLVGDTANVITRADFESRYDLTDPNRDKKINAAVSRAKKSLSRRKVSVPIETLRTYIDNLPDEFGVQRETLKEIVTQGAFNARKYLVNTGGTTIFDAQRDMSYLERKLGPEKYKFLQEQSGAYHNALATPFEIVKEAGIYTPELIERMELNKNNYVTANNLKYFEGDHSVDSSIRASVGSLSDIGNELNSTSLKIKAITERAYYQRAQNSAVDIARATGAVAEIIKPKWSQNIFDLRNKLSGSDKDHSYMIKYVEGKPALYKIKDKAWEQMFNNIRDIPVVGGFLNAAQGLNNIFLTRQLKTALSPAFIINQKRIDRKHEAMMANALGVTKLTGVLAPGNLPRLAGKLFGLPVHAQSKLREIDTSTIAEIKHYKKTGELKGGLKRAVDLDAVALELHHGEIEGVAHTHSFERAVYEAFGTDFDKLIPEAKTKVGQLIQQTKHTGETIANTIDGSKTARWLSGFANFDELRTKVNGYKIGKESGMTDSQAAMLARERFGNPDPLDGGIAAPVISSMFLFGRAHFNGLRNIYQYAKEFPKAAMTHGALMMLPKLMGATAIMVPALQSIYGDDTAEKYKKMVNMIPENEWITKTIVPLGFQDDKGRYHNFFDVKNSEIGADWKAIYERNPQAHEFTAMSRVLWPLFKELGQGHIAGAISGVVKGSSDNVAANVQPLIRYTEGLFTMITGGNPVDSFRQKPILSKEVHEGGTPVQKGAAYGEYVFSQQLGSLIPYNPFRTTDPKGALETTLSKAPVIGPLSRAVIGVTNYGNAEIDKNIAAKKDQEVARIRLSVDDTTSHLLEQYTIARAQTTSLGKGWQTKVSPEAATQIKILTSWQTKVWTPYKNEMLAAKEAGNTELYNQLLNSLQKYSGQVRASLLPSPLPELPEPDSKAK